jgi:hypothetical protein
MEQSTYLHTCFVLLLLELFGTDTLVVFVYEYELCRSRRLLHPFRSRLWGVDVRRLAINDDHQSLSFFA